MSEVIEQESLPAIPQATTMFQVLERAASNPDVNIEKMQGLYEMMNAERDRQAKAEFSAAFTAGQGACIGIKKQHWNKQTQSWYVDQGVVADAVNDAFNDHGISLSFSEGETTKDNYVRVLCDLRHDNGYTEQRYIDMPVVTTGIKGAAMMTLQHAVQSAFTYGKRNLTVLIANLPTFGKDDDGQTPVEKALNVGKESDSEAIRILNEAADKGAEAYRHAFRDLTAAQRNSLQPADVKPIRERAGA